MTNPITAESSTATCRYYLQQLGWSLSHPKVTDWLMRVQSHYSGSLWAYGESTPEFVKAGLARFLDSYLKCQHLLNALGWNWQHPMVLEVEKEFGWEGKLPLEGYQRLLKLLEEEQLSRF